MPTIERKELERISKRIKQIYEALDGNLDDKKTGIDEFTKLQMEIKEDIILLRENQQKKHQMESKGQMNIELRQLDLKIRNQFSQTQQKYAQMKKQMTIIEKSNDQPAQMKSNKKLILEKLGEALESFERSLNGNEESMHQDPERKRIRLSQLQQELYKKKQNQFIDFDETVTDNENDQIVMDQWDEKDKLLDNKLENVIDLLDQIAIENNNLKRKIEIRNELIVDNKEKAIKVNFELNKQNNQLHELLKKYRAPSKWCMDICLCLVLVGLISVLIMLIKNGK